MRWADRPGGSGGGARVFARAIAVGTDGRTGRGSPRRGFEPPERRWRSAFLPPLSLLFYLPARLGRHVSRPLLLLLLQSA